MWKLTIYIIKSRQLERKAEIETVSFQCKDLGQSMDIIELFERAAIKGNGRMEYTLTNNKDI